MTNSDARADTTDDSPRADFRSVLQQGRIVDIYADRFWYSTSTVIRDVAPNVDGGLWLRLDATIEAGSLVLTPAMIDAAEYDVDRWELRHEGFVFKFDLPDETEEYGDSPHGEDPF